MDGASPFRRTQLTEKRGSASGTPVRKYGATPFTSPAPVETPRWHLSDCGTSKSPSARPHGTTEELTAIREELEALQARRAALEKKRAQLLAESLPPPPRPPTVATAVESSVSPARGLSATPSVQRSRRRSAPSSYHVDAAASCSPGRGALGDQTPIPSESARRKRLQATASPHLAMKNAMREAAARDSTCVMGCFQTEDCPRAYTFGRERRFQPLVGKSGGYYYLDSSTQQAQRLQRSGMGIIAGAAVCGTPGPGAYTPRYNKVYRPSPLSYL